MMPKVYPINTDNTLITEWDVPGCSYQLSTHLNCYYNTKIILIDIQYFLSIHPHLMSADVNGLFPTDTVFAH